MDVSFEILIPVEVKISFIKFEQPVFEWEGEVFPQGNKEARFHYFKMIESEVPEHIVSLLPDHFKKEQWQCISIIDGLDDLICELSSTIEPPAEKSSLQILLSSITEIGSRWVVVFEPDNDRIDEVLKGNIDVAIRKIADSLIHEKNGFVIWFEE